MSAIVRLKLLAVSVGDVHEAHCYECRFRGYTKLMQRHHCLLFDDWLTIDIEGKRRLDQCLEAERAAKSDPEGK